MDSKLASLTVTLTLFTLGYLAMGAMGLLATVVYLTAMQAIARKG